MRTKRRIASGSLIALLLGACAANGSSSGSTSSTASVSGASSSAPIPATQLAVTAPVGSSISGFRETALEAPAAITVRIEFHNDDVGVPHNIQIFNGTATTGTPLWAPPDNAMILGVATTVYEVPGLPAGTYAFNCYAHPATMIGTLTVT